MACIITYENKQYTQKEFEQYFKEHFTEFIGEFINSTSALKTSLGKELEYKDPYVPTGSLKNFKQYQVLDEKNNDIGSVVIEYRGDKTVILHPKLTITGKGYGKDLYKLISSKFNVDIQEWNEGAIANTNAAKKMWDSLEKEGVAERIVDEEQGDNFRILKYRKVGSKADIEGFKEFVQNNPQTNYQEANTFIEQQLLKILNQYNIPVKVYKDLLTKLGVDAYGFTKLIGPESYIGIAELRDKFTLSEEAGHIFFAMLTGTPFYDRIINQLGVNDYYKNILGEEYQQYFEEYKGDVNKLKIEAAGKLLGRTLVTKIESIQNQPTGLRLLLAKIREFLHKMMSKFPYSRIEAKMGYIMNEIGESIIDNKFQDLGASKLNIPNEKSTLYRLKDNVAEQKKLSLKALESVLKRVQYYKTIGKEEEVKKYQDQETKLLEKIEEANYLEGIANYLTFTSLEYNNFNTDLDKTVETIDSKEKLTSEFIGRASGSLRRMKIAIDANLHTLEQIVKELSEETRHNKELKSTHDALIQQATEIYNNYADAEKAYYDLSATIVSAMMEPLLGDRNSQELIDSINLNKPKDKQLKLLNIEDSLKKSEGDISLISRWIDALADTPDDILRIIDLAVKNQKNEANDRALNDRKDLVDAQEELYKAGIKSTDFVFEKVNNKPTGNFVTEVDWNSYEEESGKFWSELNRTLNEEFEVESWDEFINNAKTLQEKYGKKYTEFRFDNKKKIKQFFLDKRLNQKEVKELIKGKDEVWLYLNTKEDKNGNVYIPRQKSKQYAEIASNPAKLKYYNEVTKLKYNLDKALPEAFRKGNLAPQIMKDWTERFVSIAKTGDKEGLINLWREAKTMWSIAEDNDERGVKYALSNDASKPIKFLPIYYTNKLKNPSEMSVDATTMMSIYSMMARDYEAMSDIVDVMELARDLIDTREVFQTDGKGNPVVENIKGLKIKLTRNLTKPKGASLTADRLADYYNMVFYGEMVKDEGRLAVLGDTFLKYNSLTMLGLNLYAGTANIIAGKSQERIDAASKEFYGEDALLFADKSYYSNLAGILDSIGSLDDRGNFTGKIGKIPAWIQHFNVLQDLKEQTKGLDAGKGFFGKLFNLSALYFLNHGGEHWIQTRTSLALAYNYRYDKVQNKFVWKQDFYNDLKLLDYKRRSEIKAIDKITSAQVNEINSKYQKLEKETKEKLDIKWKEMTNYFDAHEVVNNRLVLKEGFKFTKDDRNAFINRTHALNKEFHGIYNDIDKSAMQQYFVGRVVMQFRKWMRPYWNRRYGKLKYHYEKGAWQEGYYNVVFRFMGKLLQDIKAGDLSIKKHWAELSLEEKANFYRAMTDVAHVLGWMILAALLSGLADDDDSWEAQFAAYQAKRAITELGSMSPLLPISVPETLRVLQSPTAAITPLKNMMDLLTPWEWGDEIERGRYKGYTKIERTLTKMTPAIGQVKDWFSPEEKMIFYNR